MSTIMRQVRQHPDVVPVFVITIMGAAFAATAIVRAGWKYTDVSFRRKSNPHPWLNVNPNQQTKFIHAHDYDKVPVKRPNYEE